VLVQGPPGTGKSHTIANLICHLLATGQRILVTAKTPRALQVLMGRSTGDEKDRENQGLIPKEIRPLCINLLGGGLDEQRSLESSVAGILARNEQWDEQRAAHEHERYGARLRLLREEKAEVDRHLRDIRESETHTHSLAQGTYCGTAARIADGVTRDRSFYGWFADAVSPGHACPISEDYLQDLLGASRRFTPEKERELGLTLPSVVASPEEISRLIELENNTSEQMAYSARGADEQSADYLSKTDVATVKAIRESLSDVASKLRGLLRSPHPWMRDAVRDISGGNPPIWRELFRVTRDIIESIEAQTHVADETSLALPDEVNIVTVFEDVRALREHVGKGGKLGWGPFRPAVVKERDYILKTVRINGRPCSEVERLAALADALRVRIECEKVWGFWTGRCERTPGPYALQIAAFKAMRDALGEALSLEGLIEKCRATLRQCPALGLPVWTDESQIERLITSCGFSLAQNAKSVAIAGIEKAEAPLAAVIAQGNPHPVARELLQAIQQRDIERFTLAEAEVRELERERQGLQKFEESLNGLRQLVPRLIEELACTSTDPCWDTRIRQIESAWRWAQAKSWIQEYTRKEDAPALVKRVHQIEDEINATIARLAALRAWSFCFSRLKESHRQHMAAWQQAMRHLGKGTGKHAPQHRREAQQHLNECREAVPAWVMPLHRVWDNVDPAPGMFDVIIIDEASQCGLEALPLFYLGKRVLIVGDDKQISPEEGFVDRNAVFQLMEQFLFDFAFKDSFHCDASIFDHAKRLCGTRRIVLKEHFRCMPEIIRFSNDLCYHDTPLVPLRQYGRNRLPPLEHVFVGSGYREGTGNRVVNRPEALAIVDKILDLCRDRRYFGKTMGIVVLQGDAQAGLIESQLLDLLGAEEMQNRRLICGNPYSFQGDERDIIFLSMVAAPNERIGPLAKPADERRFNVAASRARDQMWLFHSVRREDLSVSDLRRRLLDFFEHTKPQQIAGIDRDELERRAAQDNRSIVRPPQPFDSWFEVDVALELLRRGYVVTPQYEVAGRRIDLIVEGGRARLAVECDGDEWHGPDRYEEDMQRQRQLERCNWEFYHVRESAFYADKESALRGLWHMLEERGIMPGGSPPPCTPKDEEDKTKSAHVDEGATDDDLEQEFPPSNDVNATNSQPHRRPDEVTSFDIQDAILECLERCPNRSCMLKSLPSRVLKRLSVLTRGNPRLEFTKRVMRGVGALKRKGFVEEYKAKNRRIRLLVSGQGRTLFE
jgi:very-short-patch-repair endonuclease